jgi:hypothetical protein
MYISTGQGGDAFATTHQKLVKGSSSFSFLALPLAMRPFTIRGRATTLAKQKVQMAPTA